MSVLPVLTYPHKILRTKCKPVAAFDQKIVKLINDMTETMNRFKGCVGIAAPQCSKDLRIIVVDVSRNKKAPGENHGLIALVNPVIIERKGSTASREGCLSIPDYTGNVERAETIKIKGKDMHGKRAEFYAVGFESVALQHEIDHLDGILFIDRILVAKNGFVFEEEFVQGEG